MAQGAQPVSPLLKEITHDFVMPSKQRNHTDKTMPSKQAFTRCVVLPLVSVIFSVLMIRV